MPAEYEDWEEWARTEGGSARYSKLERDAFNAGWFACEVAAQQVAKADVHRCDACYGRGDVWPDPARPCPKCNGSGLAA